MSDSELIVFHPAQASAGADAQFQLDGCWNEIGVYGSGSCPELPTHIHCRNCPVYSSTGAKLLNRDLPAEYRHEWTQRFSRKEGLQEGVHLSAVLFRVAREWLALPTDKFQEVCEWRQIHSLPHRSQGAVLGLANVRGELLICVSLGHLLRLEDIAPVEKVRQSYSRLLVVSLEGDRVGFVVDHVHGPHRFRPEELKAPPATLARSRPAHTAAILHWQDRTVGLLDPAGLFPSLKRITT